MPCVAKQFKFSYEMVDFKYVLVLRRVEYNFSSENSETKVHINIPKATKTWKIVHAFSLITVLVLLNIFG